MHHNTCRNKTCQGIIIECWLFWYFIVMFYSYFLKLKSLMCIILLHKMKTQCVFLLTQFLSCSLTKLCLQLGNDAFYLTKLPSIKCKWTATWYQNFSKILSLDREKIAVIFPPFDACKRQLGFHIRGMIS